MNTDLFSHNVIFHDKEFSFEEIAVVKRTGLHDEKIQYILRLIFVGSVKYLISSKLYFIR